MKDSIFRAYDIRGIYPSELNEHLAEKIGKAFGTFIYSTESAKKRALKFGGDPIVAIGGDSRLHTPSLKESFIRGLVSTGVQVVDFGMLPTPMLYFSVAYKRMDGGVVVTASHNTKEYNGFKFCVGDAVFLNWENGIKALLESVKSEKFKSGKPNEVKYADIAEEYKHYVSDKVTLRWMDNKKVVIDSGNGVCANVARDLFELAGCKVVSIFSEPNGSFPNHQPDPVKKSNLQDLQKAVLENKADLGVAYDGDGDRVGFVGPDGKVMESHIVLSVLAKDVLKNKPNSKIVFDLRSSKAVEDVIKSCGGVPVECRIGRSYIQGKLLKDKCELGGEYVGHFFFRNIFGLDDGIFASLKFFEIISKDGFDKLTKGIPQYMTSDEVRVFCKDEEKFDTVEKIKNNIKTRHVVSELDGVKAQAGDGWFLIRASNTEPALTIRWEAKTQEEFEKIKGIIKEAIGKYGLDTNW